MAWDQLGCYSVLLPGIWGFLRSMDWDDLRYFAELARTGSLSASARTLRVDHSTVARRITSLEEALGIRLFDRLPRGYVLTPEGEHVQEHVARLEEDVFALQRNVQGRGPGLSGTVRVSAPPAFASLFLSPRLGLLRERHPDIVLELSGSNVSVSLTRREADIALRLARPEGSSLITRKVATAGYGLFASRAHAGGREPDALDLLGYEESLEHVPQQQWLRHFAKGRPLVFRTSDLVGLHSAVKAGLGAAVLPFFVTGSDPDLVCVQREGVPGRDLWLVVHEDVRRSPRVRAVMDVLVEILGRERALLEGNDPGK
ncbi:LysR family transcriptional regulator [Microvirga sp. M2]|uniref:LysR family transcriptional regulator n=1 Tax=Microvirga sp. M2 TaxID=3073270 RepID=UPI0039C00AB9